MCILDDNFFIITYILFSGRNRSLDKTIYIKFKTSALSLQKPQQSLQKYN